MVGYILCSYQRSDHYTHLLSYIFCNKILLQQQKSQFLKPHQIQTRLYHCTTYFSNHLKIRTNTFLLLFSFESSNFIRSSWQETVVFKVRVHGFCHLLTVFIPNYPVQLFLYSFQVVYKITEDTGLPSSSATNLWRLLIHR